MGCLVAGDFLGYAEDEVTRYEGSELRLTEALDARAERGVSVLLIEHHMDVIVGICDRMLALNYGEMIASGIPKEVIKDPRVIRAYIGDGHGE